MFDGFQCARSVSETANSTDDDASREDLKRDLLLAHMLSLLTQQHGSVPPHALPALANYLTEKGLMPRWVQVRPFWRSRLPTALHCSTLTICKTLSWNVPVVSPMAMPDPECMLV